MKRPLAKAAELEISWRRHISRRDLRGICATPRVRELILPLEGTIKYPGRPSQSDLLRNSGLMRGICETFPDRIPGIQVLADAISLLDTFCEGKVLQCPGGAGYATDAHKEACFDQAARLKTMIQRLRRLFRRSSRSRSFLSTQVQPAGPCNQNVFLAKSLCRSGRAKLAGGRDVGCHRVFKHQVTGLADAEADLPRSAETSDVGPQRQLGRWHVCLAVRSSFWQLGPRRVLNASIVEYCRGACC